MKNKIKEKFSKENIKKYAKVAGVAIVSTTIGFVIGTSITKKSINEDLNLIKEEADTFKIAYGLIGLATLDESGGDRESFNKKIFKGQRMMSRLSVAELNEAGDMKDVSDYLKYIYINSKGEI